MRCFGRGRGPTALFQRCPFAIAYFSPPRTLQHGYDRAHAPLTKLREMCTARRKLDELSVKHPFLHVLLRC
eukprot:735743-Pyramimonas_sp.AAC.2